MMISVLDRVENIVRKYWLLAFSPFSTMFLGIFSPLTSAEACEKSSQWLWKEKLC